MGRSPMPSAAVASSSTLWATASKDWVIPAKPKPGRKPKKELLQHQPVDPAPSELDSKGRRVQNRAAQRAFRERKQNQLADLQARVQQYEQGEIERNVALQSISKRLKEENESLKRENATLLSELDNLRSKLDLTQDNKRLRSEEPVSSKLEDSRRKRIKQHGLSALTPASLAPSPAAVSVLSFTSSPSPLVSSPESCDSVQSILSPLSYSTPTSTSYPNNASSSDHTQLHSGRSDLKGVPYSNVMLDNIVDCGFCSEDTPCVCRELALQQVASAFVAQPQPSDEKVSRPEKAKNSKDFTKFASGASEKDDLHSLLDDLPAYQPPLPLPKRVASSKKSTQPVFRLISPTNNVASCSGDPSNCAACADDPFGQAFCAALGDAVASNGACSNCPCRVTQSSSSACSSPSMFSPHPSDHPSPLNIEAPSGDVLPRAEAWKRIKSHPNAAFADLRLLAEVVARKSACTGPSVDVVDSADIDPESALSEDNAAQTTSDVEDSAILLTDPHARYHQLRAEASALEHEASHPSLVPQDILIRCGQKRVLDVRADGVRDALRLLDSRFTS